MVDSDLERVGVGCSEGGARAGRSKWFITGHLSSWGWGHMLK